MERKIGITLGDPAGISPEILIKSLKKLPEATYIIYGSKTVLEKTAKSLNINFSFTIINSPDDILSSGLYLINLYDKEFEAGKPSVESGKASVVFLERAVDDILKNRLDAIVTLPISKKYIMDAGFNYPGHTEYLAKRSHIDNYVMMLMCDRLKVALITTHIPLKDVPKNITVDNLVSKIKTVHRELISKFNIQSPRIAVLGLNPHAGDGGNIGDEELSIIEPACKKLIEQGIDVTLPLSADTAFNRYKEFDVFVAMYHDQGLIPLKLLCFKKAVNITLGLPFIRTSPDHGTGYDIAGKNIADPSSFIHAVKLAYKLSTLNKKHRL